jgi:hypothetical protein
LANIKKLLPITPLIITLLCSAVFSGCGGGRGDKPQAPLSISDFAVYPEDAVYVYEGDEAALGDWHVFHDYIGGGRVQKRFVMSYASTIEVLDFSGGELKQVYGLAELNAEGRVAHADFRAQTENADIVLLKEPIELGRRWVQSEMAGNGAESEITALDKEITVPYGTFSAVEVTTVHESGKYEQRDYYAKGVGLIKVDSIIDGAASSSALSRIMTEQTLTAAAGLFYPSGEPGVFAADTINLTYKTNSDPADLIKEAAAPRVKELFGVDLSAVTILGVSVEPGARRAAVNFSKEVYPLVNKTPDEDAERLIIQCAANTLGYLYNVDEVMITVEGLSYKSGKVTLGDGEYISADFAVEIRN